MKHADEQADFLMCFRFVHCVQQIHKKAHHVWRVVRADVKLISSSQLQTRRRVLSRGVLNRVASRKGLAYSTNLLNLGSEVIYIYNISTNGDYKLSSSYVL